MAWLDLHQPFYVEHGLIVTKVSKVISFRQSKLMGPYIDFNTEMRKKAKNDFGKDFYKLMYVQQHVRQNDGKCAKSGVNVIRDV